MDDGDICVSRSRARLAEPISRFEAEQAAADDNDARAAPCCNVVDIIDIPEGQHAAQRYSGNRELDRLRAGRKNEPGEGKQGTVFQPHRARDRIDSRAP
jgi:hypothetical protein